MNQFIKFFFPFLTTFLISYGLALCIDETFHLGPFFFCSGLSMVSGLIATEL